MPISMLNSLLTKFEKGLQAAVTAALPVADAAESRQLLEGSKSDVEGVIKGSLLRTEAGAVSYIPVCGSCDDSERCTRTVRGGGPLGPKL